MGTLVLILVMLGSRSFVFFFTFTVDESFDEVVERDTQLFDHWKTFSKTWHFPGRLSTGNGGTGALWRKKREISQHHQANC